MYFSGESGDYCLQIWKQETHKLLQMVETLFYFFRIGQHLLVGAWATAAPVALLVSERSMASHVGVPISGEKYKNGHYGRWQGSPLLSEGRPTSPPLRQLPQCAFYTVRLEVALRQAQAAFPSQPPGLPGAAAVVGDGGVVCDGDHCQAPHRQSLDGRLEGAEGTGECHGPGNGVPACPEREGQGVWALTRFDTYDPNPILPSQRSPNRGPTHALSSVHFSSDTCPLPPRALQSKNKDHL